jgi:uncharacterized membrane protein
VHPFDPKSVLLAKHAQHVVLVHFPIALFLTGVVFDLAARGTKNAARAANMAAAARLNMIAAAIAVVPTLVTGIAAWQWQLAGQKLKGLLLLHLVLGCTSSFLICLVACMHFRRKNTSEFVLPGYYLPLELLTTVVVALTAHIGGFLSGVNIPG